jgi:hypothetical protein
MAMGADESRVLVSAFHSGAGDSPPNSPDNSGTFQPAHVTVFQDGVVGTCQRTRDDSERLY